MLWLLGVSFKKSEYAKVETCLAAHSRLGLNIATDNGSLTSDLKGMLTFQHH